MDMDAGMRSLLLMISVCIVLPLAISATIDVAATAIRSIKKWVVCAFNECEA